MIFVDTSAWFASVVPWDADYSAANGWFQRNAGPLLTTDYVIDETLTLLRARGERARAVALGARFFAGQLAVIHYLSTVEIRHAWDIFQKFHDKDWSFTDCTSKVVMESLGVAAAAAFDVHFRQFGTVLVVP